MGLFKKRPYISLKQNPVDVEESEKTPMIPDGKWIQCPHCQKTVYLEDIGEFQICPNCDYHFRLTPKQRISIMTDEFEEWFNDEQMKVAVDFPGYDLKQKKARQTTGEEEAVTVGLAKISHLPFVLAIMNPYFMMGSMGQVVGEKLTLAFEEATKRKLPIIVCTASGGARMQEGIYSLMQMAKISGAVQAHHLEGLLYITVLTDPTTGGVTASFAMQGDIIISEPRAIVGFAGKRVIEQTMKEKLPNDFQQAETVQANGFIDAIIHRTQLKETLKTLLSLHSLEEEFR